MNQNGSTGIMTQLQLLIHIYLKKKKIVVIIFLYGCVRCCRMHDQGCNLCISTARLYLFVRVEEAAHRAVRRLETQTAVEFPLDFKAAQYPFLPEGHE